MRGVVAMSISIAVSCGAVAVAQSEPPSGQRTDAAAPQENPEQVIVRGRRLSELRFEVQVAREHAYDIFNAINSNDDFDVYCREEGRTGTRSTDRVCRAQFEKRISAAAAREYMSALSWRCPAQLTGQECMFSDYSAQATSAAQGVESQGLSMRDQMKQEIVRLANQDEKFAQAILDWFEANQQYEAARKRRDE